MASLAITFGQNPQSEIRNPQLDGCRPAATYCLLAAQVVVWIVVRRFLLTGDDWTDLALLPGAPSGLGLLISPFVHLETMHLGVNLLVLWLFGSNLERAVGSLHFLFLYLGAAWFASLMQWATFTAFNLDPNVAASHAAVGSSGAVAGVLGAGLVRLPQGRLRFPLLPQWTFPTAPLLVLWLAYTFARALVTTVLGVEEGVGHWAHFAGFVFGLGLAQIAGLQQVARLEHLQATASSALATGNYRAASLALSALLSAQPDDEQARRALIQTRVALRDRPGASRVAGEGLRRLIRADRRIDALNAYREFSGLVGGLTLPSGVRYRLATWLEEAGEWEAAYRAFVESVPEDGGRDAAASALYRAGRLAFHRLESVLHARAAWERLIEQFPDSHWAETAGREMP